jgi:hypothetical protein
MRVRAASMLGAQRPAQLAQVALQGALGRVPGLAAEAGLPAAGVHSLALDPLDSGRLGFHLTCGWSGARTALDPLDSGGLGFHLTCGWSSARTGRTRLAQPP